MKHLDVVAAIVIYKQQILCMQRGKAPYEYTSYKYEFPGGKIEAGESRTEALMRELKEEMNLAVKIAEEDYFLTVNHNYQDFEITMHSYLCYINSPEFTRREHIAHKWASLEELRELDWAGADLPIIEKLLQIGFK